MGPPLQPQPSRRRLAAAVALVAVVFLHLSQTTLVRGSEGDESPLFQECLRSCLSTGCTKTPGSSNTCDTVCDHSGASPSSSSLYVPPWTLRLMQWDCESDCAYHCMWALETPKAHGAAAPATASAAAPAGSSAPAQEPVYKYYGKWPFVRVLGAQEIASVLFSIANLLAHVHNLRNYLQQHRQRHLPGGRVGFYNKLSSVSSVSASAASSGQQQQQYPFHFLWVTYAAANINAWLWSSVFHCRDTRVTERLDYFSADLTVVVGCGVVVARMLQLTSPRQLLLLCLLLGAGLAQHIHYMAFVKFDYGYNMSLCIALGIATAAAWLAWVTRSRHPGRAILYKFMALVHVAMLLEVLDFPPLLQLFDAHALWHAATVPLTYLWYRFVAADVAAWEACSSGGGGGQSSCGGVGEQFGAGNVAADKQKL